jgi:PPM family protein phosphatase
MSVDRSPESINRNRCPGFPSDFATDVTRSLQVMFDYAISSEKGPRRENEDSVGAWELSDGGLAIAIADGLGGHMGGKFASRLAIEHFRQATETGRSPDLTSIARAIHTALKAAQERQPELRSMATTFSAAVLNSNKLHYVHCGDTRIALQRGGGIQRLTEDHSEAQRLFAAGKLTKEELINYPRKNVLESALGASNEPTIDAATIELTVGDRIFITSDGVHGKILLREMKRLSDESRDATTFVFRIVDAVKARGPDDNFSIVAAFLV